MFKNHIKVSIRGLIKKRQQTTVNFIGLITSIVSFLIISLFIYHELSFNSNFSGYENIYRINQDFSPGEEKLFWATTPSALLPNVQASIKDLENGTIVFDISQFSTLLIDGGQGNQEEKRFAFADTSFFKVFDLEFIAGAQEKVLADPDNLVLTESTAKKYFETPQKAIGKTLKINNSKEFKVAGVIEDFPSNSTLNFDFIGSFLSQPHGKDPSWSNSNYHTYLKLNKDADPGATENSINKWIADQFGEDLKSSGTSIYFTLANLRDIHFDTTREMYGTVPTLDIRYLKLLAFVAVLMILVGCANFINLSTAESTERSKEIGLRKIVGSSRFQLFSQYFIESMILTGLCIFLALVVIQLISGVLEDFLGLNLDFTTIYTLQGILFILVLFFSVSFLAGFYPAVFLSGIRPLKNISLQKTNTKSYFRKGLVVFQFFVSISLVLSTFIVESQLSFLQEANLGFDREQLVVLPINYKIQEQVNSFGSEIKRKDLVASVSKASNSPVHVKSQYTMSLTPESSQSIPVTGYLGDHELIKTLGIVLLSGQGLHESDLKRSQTPEDGEFPVLINQKAAEALGWSEDAALNKRFYFDGSLVYVKGVMEDFNFNSLHKEVGPLVIYLEPDYSTVLLLRLSGSSVSENLSALKLAWNELIPDRPFSYEFADQQYQLFYSTEEKLSKIFSLFSLVSLVVSGLGLLGLVSYFANQKSKEISVRRVLGAGFLDILKFLTRDFVILLVVSTGLAILFGNWFSKVWLGSFAYHVDLSFLIYAFAVLSVLGISLLIVSFRTWKIFVTNPVETLQK
ncbi:ABC transporter [Algoriphagus lacus]|uniref:ABC transporter n=1 Tax=Algoriphagus lacus TaxID=2056311 RepID=A0A418PNM4_9BACT|nr:ABC transporter permease [Algoriphagus lacus]RIW13427.1 ABC transporter [Algoriphagus lacus]